jgi:PAS domain S-box-containing protein
MIKRYCISIGITALLYFGVAKLVFSSLQLGLEPAPLWPPAGIALFVLLQQGRRVWPGVAIGILMMGQWLGISWPLAIGSAVGGTLEAVIGATLLRWIGFHQALDRLRDVLGLIGLAGLIAPLLSATLSIGTAVLMGQLSEPLASQFWWTIWLGNSMGILVFTPLLLISDHSLQHRPRLSVPQVLRHPHSLETLLCFSLLIGSSWLVFHSQPHGEILHYPIEYLSLPFVIWAALRLGQTPGIVASFLLCVIAITGTTAEKGPFITAVDAPRQLILLQQAFLGVTTMTALVIGVMAAEQRRIAALLRRSQANLAKAQEIANLGSWEFNFAQQQWSWSEQLYRLLGVSAQQVGPSQVTFLQAVHPDDRAEVEQIMTKAFTHQIPYRTNYRLKLADGTERTVEEQVSVTETTATGTVLDITEFKQTEQKLRINAESNRLLSEIALRIRKSLDLEDILNTTVQEVRQFLQADRVFICQFDAEGRGEVVAESVLPGWTSALGWTSPVEVYPEIQAMFTDSLVCRVNDTNDPSDREYTPFIRDYHERYQVRAGLGVALVADGNSDGNSMASPAPLSGLLIAHQCTHPREWQPLEIELLEQLAVQVTIAIQQGKFYQQVQHLNNNLEQQVAERTLQLQVNLAKLEEMNQLQGVFLHAIAHDLRTTIMGTLMVLNHMQQQAGDQISMSRSTLNRMAESGNIQLRKLNSLLEAYSNRTEGVVLDRVPTHLPQVLQTVIASLQSLFDHDHIQVNCQSCSEEIVLMADPVKLEQVLRHLLTNAVKHNPPGTQITVRTEVQSQMLHLSVEDNGKGIAPADARQLFELKIRQGEDRQRVGIGVGLCLCHQIITAHGGTIGVESEPGQGSRFWFTLPLATHPLLEDAEC